MLSWETKTSPHRSLCFFAFESLIGCFKRKAEQL